MYVSYRAAPQETLAAARPKGPKPKVLFVLAGAHHLMLYENLFRYGTDFDWFCLLPGLPEVAVQRVTDLYHRFGLRCFTDPTTALANFASFDAVITTWSVPHRKHVPYLPFIALAYESGIPVFEMQHGLFQLGLSYDEHAPFIGSMSGAAACIAGAPNLVSAVLTWSGPDGIGYPRAVDTEPATGLPDPRRTARVVFITNHHWTILRPEERQNCYAMMQQTILAFPEVDFVMLPHEGELKSQVFKDMLAALSAAGAVNHRIEYSREVAVYDGLLHESDLLVASVSTTILDCEWSGTPTVVFRNPSQDALTRTFPEAHLVDTPADLETIVRDTLYRGYRPALTTGQLEPYRPDALSRRLLEAIDTTPRKSRSEILQAVARHIPQT